MWDSNVTSEHIMDDPAARKLEACIDLLMASATMSETDKPSIWILFFPFFVFYKDGKL
jgi:hypothetical protein